MELTSTDGALLVKLQLSDLVEAEELGIAEDQAKLLLAAVAEECGRGGEPAPEPQPEPEESPTTREVQEKIDEVVQALQSQTATPDVQKQLEGVEEMWREVEKASTPEPKSNAPTPAAEPEGAPDGGAAAATGDSKPPQQLPLRQRLTPDERSLVLKHRIVEVCGGLIFTACMPHWNASYMELVNGDAALMARHYGLSASIISCFEMFTGPFVASLSDTIGRRYLASIGRIGWIMFFAGYRIRDLSLPFRLWSEVVCWGVVQAGVWTVFSAQHSDIFGERPKLSAEIRSVDKMWSDYAGFAGPFVAKACTMLVGEYFSEYLVSAITALSMGVLLSIPETLMDDRPEGSASWTVKPDRKPAHRKPFRLSTANPIANIALLFRNGPGLRALATATTIDFSNNE